MITSLIAAALSFMGTQPPAQFNMIGTTEMINPPHLQYSNFTGNSYATLNNSTMNFHLYHRYGDDLYIDYPMPEGTDVAVNLTFIEGRLEEASFEVTLDGAFQFILFEDGTQNININDFDNLRIVKIPCLFSGPYLDYYFGPIAIWSHAQTHWGNIRLQRVGDNYTIVGYSHENIVDMNLDGEVNSTDFMIFMDWFAEGDSYTDLTQNGIVDSQDYFEFLNRFFAQ